MAQCGVYNQIVKHNQYIFTGFFQFLSYEMQNDGVVAYFQRPVEAFQFNCKMAYAWTDMDAVDKNGTVVKSLR